jgi:hypothetical protein
MQVRKTLVNSIQFVVSGTYNNMVSRPYETNVDPRTFGAFVDQTRQGTLLSTQALAGIAGQIIKPVAMHQGIIAIPNGWQTRRLMFLMTLEIENMGASVTNYISGFTDHGDYVNRDGNIILDPNMRLYINNVITVRNNARVVAGLGNTNIPMLADAAHFVRGNTSSSFDGGSFQHRGQISMRPEDLVGRIDEMHISKANDGMAVFGSNASFATGARRSRLNNSNPAAYLSKTLTAISDSYKNHDYRSDHTEVMESARTNLSDGSIQGDPFFFQLNKHAENFLQNGSFTWSELMYLQPDIDARAKVWEPRAFEQRNQGMGMSTQHGTTADWTGGTRESISAEILRHSVPALMAEFLLTGVGLSIRTGSMVPLPGALRVVSGITPYDVLITKYMAYGGERTDMSGMIPRFVERLVKEIVTDITANNLMEIELHGEFSLGITENKLNLRIGDGVLTPYADASFTSSLSLPIIATSMASLDQLASDINHLSGQISTTSQVQTMGNLNNVDQSSRFVL